MTNCRAGCDVAFRHLVEAVVGVGFHAAVGVVPLRDQFVTGREPRSGPPGTSPSAGYRSTVGGT